MNTRLSLSLVFIPLLAIGPALGAETGETARVGKLGRLPDIRFEGQRCFSDQDMRFVLRLQLEYLFAAEPDQPLGPLLQVIEKLLRTGYQASGFADAKVAAGLNSASNQVVVRITEGPRLYFGTSRVEGLKGLATNLFLKTLRETLAPGGATNHPAPTGSPVGGSGGFWAAGSPVGLDPASWAGAELLMTNVFSQLGYFVPEFTVDFKRRPAQPLDLATLADTNALTAEKVEILKQAAAEGRLVDMVVQVTHEGPQCTLARLRGEGTRHPDKELGKFVGWRPGEPFTSRRREQLMETLSESGRFTRVDGSLEGGATNGRLTAVLHLEDLPEAPASLTNRLSTNAETLLRMRRWVMDWTNRAEDMVWEFRIINASTCRTSLVELVCSPTGNLACQVLRGEQDASEPKPQFQFIVKPAMAGLWTADAATKFLNTNFSTALQLGGEAHVVAQPSDEGDRGNLTFYFGFSTDTENKPPLTLTLKTSAAAMVFLAQRPDFEWRTEGALLVGMRSNVCLRVDTATARLVELKGTYRPPEQSSWKGAGEWKLGFQPGRFAHIEADWARATAGLPNVYDRDHALASGLAYLLRGFAGTKTFTGLFPTNVSATTLTDAQAAFAGLFNADFFYGLERFLPELKPPGAGRDHMQMPLLSDNVSEQASQALNSLFAMVLGQVPEVVPPGTWLEAAFKLPLLTFAGRPAQAHPLVHRLWTENQLGPVSFLVLGHEFSNPQAARQYAISGLLQSSSQDFLRDARPLLDEKSGLGHMTTSLARSLGKLDDRQLESICALFNPREAALVRQAALALRQGGPIPETLEPFLEQWWNASLKDPVKAGLRTLSRARSE